MDTAAPDTPGLVPAARFEPTPNFEVTFPPLPRTVAEVSAMLAERRDVPDTPRLIEVVNADPMVATAVLRRVNSAYYGLRRQVGELRQAVFLLGFQEVSNLVLSASMMKLQDVFGTEEQVQIFEQLIRLSLGTAVYQQHLAEHLEHASVGKAFTLGLLGSVGRLVLLYNIPDDYEALWFTSDDGPIPSAANERIIFGIDHAQLGAHALTHWKLPAFYAQIIGHASTPGKLREPEHQEQALMLAASTHVNEHLCLAQDPNPATYAPPPALHRLAKLHDTSSQALRDLFVEHHESVQQYIDTMTS